jgi:general secretion pathway protein G
MRLRWVIVAAVIVLAAGAGVYVVQQRAEAERVQKAQHEAALRDALAQLRGAIAKFHADNKRYPHSLDELVPNYIRRIPTDPMTGTASWRLTTEETVQVTDDFSTSTAPKSESVVLDVHSSAPGYGDY